MITKLPSHKLYKYVKSNNTNAKYIHIVKGLTSSNGNINASLVCGNNMGTQKGLTFCVSNKKQPCKKCIEVSNSLNN